MSFISEMEDLLKAYKICNDPLNDINREIHMWRKRFCEENNLTQTQTDIFLSIPSAGFLNISLKSHLLLVKEYE